MDLIFSRYNSSVMDLDIETGIMLIKKAYEEKTNSILWSIWLTKLPWMDEKSFISFDEFKSSLLKNAKDIDEKCESKEEIIAKSEQIIKVWKGGMSIGR